MPICQQKPVHIKASQISVFIDVKANYQLLSTIKHNTTYL